MANKEWRLKFPEASVTNLPRTSSDHCPLLVITEGKIKVNSDGSCMQAIGYASYGGLARNDQGRWIEGFCGRTGAGSALAAELVGIRQALKLVKERQWRTVDVESDSLVAVKLINSEEDIENHPDKALIQDCRKLMNQMDAKLYHILREANRCADKMAKLGSTQTEQCVRILIPPDDVVEDLMADMVGVAFPRGS